MRSAHHETHAIEKCRELTPGSSGASAANLETNPILVRIVSCSLAMKCSMNSKPLAGALNDLQHHPSRPSRFPDDSLQ
jgi:hypothetical protein